MIPIRNIRYLHCADCKYDICIYMLKSISSKNIFATFRFRLLITESIVMFLIYQKEYKIFT